MDLEARIRKLLAAEDALKPDATYAYETIVTRGRQRRTFILTTQLAAAAVGVAVVVAGTASLVGGSSRLEPTPPNDGSLTSIAAPATTTTSTPTTATSTPTTVANAPTTLTVDQWVSAEGIFGWALSETAIYDEVEREVAIASAREDVIAACMQRDGFEYHAIAQDFVASVIEDPDRPRGTPKWRDRYGFGITTLSFEQSEVGPEGIGFDPGWVLRPPHNPNGAIYNGLSEADRTKYDESYDSCVKSAADAVPDPVRDVREPLAAELEMLDESVRALSTYAQLRAEFTGCLSEPGLAFEGLESIEQHITAAATEAGLFDEEPSEEQRIESIVEVQTVERELASQLEKCGGLAEWERRYAELAEPLRREFAATHLELIGS